MKHAAFTQSFSPKQILAAQAVQMWETGRLLARFSKSCELEWKTAFCFPRLLIRAAFAQLHRPIRQGHRP